MPELFDHDGWMINTTGGTKLLRYPSSWKASGAGPSFRWGCGLFSVFRPEEWGPGLALFS